MRAPTAPVRAALLAAVRARPGSSGVELRLATGIPGYDSAQDALRRLEREGAVWSAWSADACVGARRVKRYYPVSR